MSKGPTPLLGACPDSPVPFQEQVLQVSHLGSLGLKFLIWKMGVNWYNHYDNT